MYNYSEKCVGRPRGRRHIRFRHRSRYFKPRGISMATLVTIDLSVEELEAMRLKNLEKLDQTECARKMKTSQSTFQRILSSAYIKVTDALVNGKAIRIDK